MKNEKEMLSLPRKRNVCTKQKHVQKHPFLKEIHTHTWENVHLTEKIEKSKKKMAKKNIFW